MVGISEVAKACYCILFALLGDSMHLKIFVVVLICCLMGCNTRYTSYNLSNDGDLLINDYKIIVKKIPSFSFVYYRESIASNLLKDRSNVLAKKLFIAANLQGLSLMGPLTLSLGDLRRLGGGPLDVSVGFPVSGEMTPVDGVQQKHLPSITCLTVSVPIDVLDIETYWAALVRATYSFG